MINYLKSELYKTYTSIYTKILLCLLIIVLFFINSFFALYSKDVTTTFLINKKILYIAFFFTPLFTELVFSSDSTYGTLKNTLSFGIGRGEIFIGKLLISMLFQLIIFFITIATCTLMPLLFFHNSLVINELSSLIRVFISALPIILCVVGITNSLEFISEDKLNYLLAFIIVMFIPNFINGILKVFDLGSIDSVNKYTMLSRLSLILDNSSLAFLETLGVGLLYFIVFVFLGYLDFRKKEL